MSRRAPLIWLVLAFFYQCSALVTAEIITREKTCPNAEDIAPCECTVGHVDDVLPQNLNMWCFDVEDEQQLYDIFHSDIPDTKFHMLALDTYKLDSLSADVFGDVTFQNVMVYSFYETLGLSSIHPETFIKSSSTLRQLDLVGNKLVDFPYETLTNYTQLLILGISEDPVISFPIIKSNSLRYLTVSNISYNAIPEGALDDLPHLWSFTAFDTNITQVPEGLFTPLQHLRSIYIGDSKLENITIDQFDLSSTALQSINLGGNQISYVEPGTFNGIQSGQVDLWDNNLTELTESTWRTVLDAGNTLGLQGNPLTCGCDVAWLVLEPSYHQFVADAVCTNGAGKLVDLDPAWFENNCHDN